MEWPLDEAKNHFGEVITLALTEGPQRVRLRNQSVIKLSESQYEQMSHNDNSFKMFLFEGPSFDDLDLSRAEDLMRGVSL